MIGRRLLERRQALGRDQDLDAPGLSRLTADQAAFDPIPVVRGDNGKIDLSKLSERFKEIREKFPDQSAITLQTDDKVRYDVLVRIIDECLGNQLPQVSVMAAAG